MFMSSPFRLGEHPRRPQPLSAPPAGYFEQLPTRLMAVAAAPRRPLLPAWLLQAPAYVRTGLASTLLLGTFAAALWLGSGALPGHPAPTTAHLDRVPTGQLVDYLTSEAPLDLADLAELNPQHLGLTRQYLRPTARELTEALDAQPADDAALL